MNFPRLHETLIAVAMLVAGTASAAAAQSYEDELASLTQQLVDKIEKASQTSGSVLDFTDLQGQPTELGRFLAQEVADNLVSDAHTFSLVDRSNLQQLLRENKLSEEGLVNPETSQKLGKLIGIDTLIFGTVTPIGDQVVKLSVRAVAVETGRVVAAQSASLPMTAELASLYTHGVAPSLGLATANQPPSAPPDIRDRIRSDSFKLTPREAVVSGYSHATNVTATFTLENLSGLGLNVGLVAEAISVGSCGGRSYVADYSASGLSLFTSSMNGGGYNQFRYLPANSRTIVTVMLPNCDSVNTWRVKTTTLSVSLIVQAQGTTFTLPLGADNVPVRVVSQ